jgi:hypothetical protein
MVSDSTQPMATAIGTKERPLLLPIGIIPFGHHRFSGLVFDYRTKELVIIQITWNQGRSTTACTRPLGSGARTFLSILSRSTKKTRPLLLSEAALSGRQSRTSLVGLHRQDGEHGHDISALEIQAYASITPLGWPKGRVPGKGRNYATRSYRSAQRRGRGLTAANRPCRL